MPPLVVDDDAAVRDALGFLLADEGYRQDVLDRALERGAMDLDRISEAELTRRTGWTPAAVSVSSLPTRPRSCG